MNSGVYAIKNLDNMKIYVGGSQELSRRKSNHVSDLGLGKHHNNYLQNAWDKHGEDAFAFTILEYIDCNELLKEREQWWINHLKPFGNYGYNICTNVTEGRRGASCPKEVRKKISLSMIKHSRTPEHCSNIATSKLGHEVTDITKAKISKSRKGKCIGSANTNAKLNGNSVLEIKKKLVDGKTGASLAREYGVRKHTIYRIRDNITWKHVEEK